MRPHWVEDKTECPPHIVWRLLDKSGIEIESFFVEKIDGEYLMDKQDIEERKRNIEKDHNI